MYQDILTEQRDGPWWQRLPFPFEAVSVEEGQRPIGFRFSRYIINIKATLLGREIIACGESDNKDTAHAKALSELIERATLISGPDSYGSLTSNGWAAHPDSKQARLNAIFEIAERDAVLAQWYSSTPFFVLDPSSYLFEIQTWIQDELSRSEFPKLSILISTQGLGPSVTCLLMNDEGRGVCSHSCKSSLLESTQSAISEACRAAHSSIRREHWKDTLKLKTQQSGSVDPGAHSLYYAYHEQFPAWMFGESISWKSVNELWAHRIETLLCESDAFSFHLALNSPINVGFVRHPKAFELVWGITDVEKVSQSPGAKRLNLKSENINRKPHIVS